MVFAGSDPTGGAGIQADIEALASMGCHAAPVITAITTQDTRNVFSISSLGAASIVEQARPVLDDMPVAAFKIGLLGSAEVAEAIHTLIAEYAQGPVVLDPILKAGGGASLSDDHTREAMRSLLFPLTTVLTPNSEEARALAPEADTLPACAQKLMSDGCEFVLLTGTHEDTPRVRNSLYGNHRHLEDFRHGPRNRICRCHHPWCDLQVGRPVTAQ